MKSNFSQVRPQKKLSTQIKLNKSHKPKLGLGDCPIEHVQNGIKISYLDVAEKF